MPCFIGFTFLAYIEFGPYHQYFHSFARAMITVLFFMLGQLDITEMMRSNSFITVVWTTAFVLFLIFVFLTMIMAIYAVSYEGTIKEQGYPSDFMDLAKWEYRDYLYWAIDWLPEKILKKIKKRNVVEEDGADVELHDSDEDKAGEGVQA
jgi:hypothetical protein